MSFFLMGPLVNNNINGHIKWTNRDVACGMLSIIIIDKKFKTKTEWNKCINYLRNIDRYILQL